MFPSPTKKSHNKGYPFISPSRPELSTKGKTVLITGGAAGVGRYIAEGFAESGAAVIGLVGRTATTLDTARNSLIAKYPTTKIHVYAADVSNPAATADTLRGFQTDANAQVDILVSCAGYCPDWKTITDTNPDDFWRSYHSNVGGAFNLAKALPTVAGPGGITVLHLSTAAALVPFVPHAAAYATSKLAAAKVWEYFGHENPTATVIGFHPGVHNDTDMGKKASAQGVVLPGDEPSLPKGLAVWLASDEAKFLNGKTIVAHFDAEELKANEDKIKNSMTFTIGCKGFPDVEAF